MFFGNYVLLQAQNNGTGEILFAFFLILFLLAFVAFCFFMAGKLSPKHILEEEKKEALRREKEAEITGVYANTTLVHLSGLPIAQNSVCFLKLKKETLEFVTETGATVTLSAEKIVDVSQKLDIDIQKQYVSSAGGAVAGGMLFGAAGAAIGGRTKEITTNNSKNYFMIAYRDDDETKNILFDATNVSLHRHGKYKDFLKINRDYEYMYKKLLQVCKKIISVLICNE